MKDIGTNDDELGAKTKLKLNERAIVGKKLKMNKDQEVVIELFLNGSGWRTQDQMAKKHKWARKDPKLTSKALKRLVKDGSLLNCSVNGHQWYKISSKGERRVEER